MVNIKNITKEGSFNIITDEEEYTQYTRYSEDCWYQRIGESIEPLYDCKELEDKFQEYYLKNIEKYPPESVKYSKYVKDINLYKDMCENLIEELKYERELKEYLIKSFKKDIKDLKEKQ